MWTNILDSIFDTLEISCSNMNYDHKYSSVFNICQVIWQALEKELYGEKTVKKS